MAKKRGGHPGGGPSRVQAHELRNTDLNTIVARYNATGELPQAPRNVFYGDFSGLEDYHAIQNRVLAAEAAFMELPSNIRSRYRNDPGELIEVMANPERKAEYADLVRELAGEKVDQVDQATPEVPAAADQEPQGDDQTQG